VLRHPIWTEAIHAQGQADYCSFEIGAERVETGLNDSGGFDATYTFDDVRAGDKVAVTASAYRTNGTRDRMKIAGDWMDNDSPYDERDKQVARATVHLIAYQRPIRFVLPKRADAFDFATAQLVIRRDDGRNSTVYQHRPPRQGFVVSPDDAGDGFQVAYLPTGDQLNPSGTTEVELSVYDQAGNRQVFTQTIDTP
jgi:hypothetical protein